MSVGQGFGSLNFSKRVNKVPPNPLDKSTIVTVFPREVRDIKATVYPGVFIIPAAPRDGYNSVIITPASWYREIDDSQPTIEIPINSMELARSIIQDYCNGLIGCDMADVMPGLFHIPGAFTNEELIKVPNFNEMLETAKRKQTNWFKHLITLADIDWARTNGNPLSIPDDARLAAEIVGIKNKPWLNDVLAFELKPCPACGVMRNPSYPICSSCHTIVDKEKFEALKLERATGFTL